MTFVHTYSSNLKTTWCIHALYVLNDCSTVGDICFLCYSWMRDKAGELWLQTLIAFLSDKQFVCCMYKLKTIGYIWTFRLSSDCSTIGHILVWFSFVTDIQLESYDSKHTSVFLWYKLVCVYCKPIYTSLFGAQMCMTIDTHVPYDCILHTKWRLYCQRWIVL